MTTESLKEKYKHHSPESIKKFLCVLENLKMQWDLTPKEDSMQQISHMVYRQEGGTAKIGHQKLFKWMETCAVSDFYELEDILNGLRQDGLIIDFSTQSESR